MNSSPSSHKVFDRTLVRSRRNRYFRAESDSRFLFDWTVENLTDRLSFITRDFPVALNLSTRHTPALIRPLMKQAGIDSVITGDLAETLLPRHDSFGPVICLDEERLPFAPNSFNLVLSALNLHTVNDLPGALIQIRRILKPDGLFLGALLGGETLRELRNALMEAEATVRNGVSPRVAPFADKQQTGALLQRAGYALPVVDSEKITVTYKNLQQLLNDLKDMGESNSLIDRSKGLSSKRLFDTAERIYRQRFTDEGGKLEATFEIIFMIGWAPHASQQKPLRPGSADTRLADALDTEEIGTGEKASP